MHPKNNPNNQTERFLHTFQSCFGLFSANHLTPCRYLVSILACALALGVGLLLQSIIGVGSLSLLLVAVGFSSLYGGIGPALLSVLITTIGANIFFIKPRYQFSLVGFADLFRLIVFTASAFFLSWISSGLRSVCEIVERQRNLVDSVLDTASDFVLMQDDQGKIVYINRSALSSLNLKSEEVLQKDLSALNFSGSLIAHLQNDLREALRSGKSILGVHEVYFSKFNKPRALEYQLTPAFHKDGSISSVVIVLRDVTDRKRLGDELSRLVIREKHARELAEHANQVKDNFLAILSHELRTPLTAILSWTQMMRLGKIPSEKMEHGLKIIEESARSQNQLINDLLDISRIQAGKLKLTLQKTNPMQVISEGIRPILAMATDKSIQLQIQIDPSLQQIYVDPDRLKQILWNLLNNSIKFTPNGGQIEVTLDQDLIDGREFARIKVRDTGKGIDPSFLPKIFDRFTQANSTTTRLHGGLGLGLSIVRNLVDLHGGKITVESSGLGKGATFTVLLPLEPTESKVYPEQTLEVVENITNEEVKSKILAGKRILVVDDEQNALEIFSIILSEFGADVLVAQSVPEAIQVFARFKPDILISDIAMPGEDGYSLIRKIRSYGPSMRGNIPCIALTAFASNDDIQRAIQFGFQEHLAKPVDAIKLIQTIQKIAA